MALMAKRSRIPPIFVRMPELAGLADEQRVDIVRRWKRAHFRSWRTYLLLLLPTLIVGPTIGGLFYAKLTGRLGPSSGSAPFFMAVIFGSFLLSIALQLWLTRRSCRQWVRRHLPGVCSTCGYNLTANASGVCPECGRRVEQKKA